MTPIVKSVYARAAVWATLIVVIGVFASFGFWHYFAEMDMVLPDPHRPIAAILTRLLNPGGCLRCL